MDTSYPEPEAARAQHGREKATQVAVEAVAEGNQGKGAPRQGDAEDEGGLSP